MHSPLAKHRDSQGPCHFCGPSGPPFSWLLHQDCGCVVLFSLKGPASTACHHIWKLDIGKLGTEKAQEDYLRSPPLPLPGQGLCGMGLETRKFGFAVQHLLSSMLSCAKIVLKKFTWADTLSSSGTCFVSGFSERFFSEGLRLGVRGVGWRARGQFYIKGRDSEDGLWGGRGQRLDREKKEMRVKRALWGKILQEGPGKHFWYLKSSSLSNAEHITNMQKMFVTD